MLTEFANEPFTDFTNPKNAKAFQAALDQVGAELGKTYDNLVGGERVKFPKTMTSVNPCKKSQAVGVFPSAPAEYAGHVMETAAKAFEFWRYSSPEQRAEIGMRAAKMLRERKHWFSAWMVYEVGKSWAEADADTAEAIDFLEFYSREALRYGGPQPITPVPGEQNELVYIPIGVCVVIPPWNFPLAIALGMTAAAILTGNTVVLKPASDSPTIAYHMANLLFEAGVPHGVLNFVTGSGSGIGNEFVKHPKTRMIAFTGSKDVGLHVNKLAAEPQPGQIWIKRVIAEMGGKDSIVVCDDANLDDAAKGIVAAAFGFQGQKCSACSRAILDAKVYDAVCEKVARLVGQIKVGEVRDPTYNMGAVINQGAYNTITKYIETGKKEGTLLAGGEYSDRDGFFIQPTVIKDIAPGAVISQEEIFGPVLALLKARDFDDALHIANNTEYGLTGAIYTASEERLERARKEFYVGNLYLNRKCTGALVGGHPFGGFNMSGTDSKAGGRDYLLLFLQAKTIARKI